MPPSDTPTVPITPEQLAALLRQVRDSCEVVRLVGRMIGGPDLPDRDALRTVAVEHERARAAELLVRYRRAHEAYLRRLTVDVLSPGDPSP